MMSQHNQNSPPLPSLTPSPLPPTQSPSPSSNSLSDFPRSFISSDDLNFPSNSIALAGDNSARLIQSVRASTAGFLTGFSSPYGPRPLLHCDHYASSKSLQFIEDFIADEIQPFYANSHTNTSLTGLQSSLWRSEARSIVARSVRADRDDCVLFAGSGSTGALQMLIHMLRLRERVAAGEKIAVFIGPYEHHAVILPLRELQVELVTIDEHVESGGLDFDVLSSSLAKYSALNYSLIGIFSAASNVTGILTDTTRVSRVIHEFGGLAIFDFASAGPYVDIDMNPMNQPLLSKDAIILSVHKFIGGAATPGILVVKKELLGKSAPFTPAGGTVFFVSSSSHRYSQNFEDREEGGTPDIIGCIRSGLVFQLKEAIGTKTITAIENSHLQTFSRIIADDRDRIIVLGNQFADRLAVISFMIRPFSDCPLFLHSNFVSVLLNDLFGIQSRSGCMCAGPYAHSLLGMSEAISIEFEKILLSKQEIIRPAFVRINLHWSLTESEVSFAASACRWIALHGYKMLPAYGFHSDTGEWRHKSRMTKFKDRRWLGSVDYRSGAFESRNAKKIKFDSVDLLGLLAEADEILAKSINSVSSMVDQSALFVSSSSRFRWFLLPSDAVQLIRGENSARIAKFPTSPINPPTWQRLEQSQNQNELHVSGRVMKTQPIRFEFAASSAGQLIELSEQEKSWNKQFQTEESKTGEINQPPAASVASALAEAEAAAESESAESKLKRPAELSESSNCFVCPVESKRPKVATAKLVKINKFNSETNSQVETGQCKICWHFHSAPPSTTTATAAAAAVSSSSSSSISSSSALKPSSECHSCGCTHFIPRLASSKSAIYKITKKLRHLTGKAILDHAMIGEGDKVMIGVSGGKDSLTLVEILLELQSRSPVKFSLACVTVDPQTPEYDPSLLKLYFSSKGIPYFYESQPIMEAAKTCMNEKSSICSFCSRMKRGILYSAMRREGYNVLALGQHADDLAESLLMSIFHNGKLRTMKANYTIGAGDLRVIRPLIYVRERQTREYSQTVNLPVVDENCPACYEAPKERARMKKLLAQQESIHSGLFSNLLTAMKPLMGIKSISEEEVEYDD